MANIHVLRFSFNWNNKLGCKSFSTLRLYNEARYVVNTPFQVYLKDQYLGIAELRAVRKTKSTNLNEFVCQLDTGYGVAETQKILKRMYKGKEETVGLHFCLFRWVKREIIPSPLS